MYQREVSPDWELSQARSMATRFWSTMSVMVQSFPCHEDKAFFKKPAHIPPWSIGRSSEYHSLSFIFLHSFIEICQEYGTGSIGDECQTARLKRSVWTSTWRSFLRKKLDRNSILWLHETAAVGNWAGKKTASFWRFQRVYVHGSKVSRETR